MAGRPPKVDHVRNGLLSEANSARNLVARVLALRKRQIAPTWSEASEHAIIPLENTDSWGDLLMPDTLPRARWRPIVEECLDSGLSVRRWSREHGIDINRMYYWVARFREEEAQQASQTRWVQLQTGETPVSDCAFEVRVGNATIVVKPGFDPEALTEVVRAIGQC